jgi:hypothetical protein
VATGCSVVSGSAVPASANLKKSKSLNTPHLAHRARWFAVRLSAQTELIWPRRNE